MVQCLQQADLSCSQCLRGRGIDGSSTTDESSSRGSCSRSGTPASRLSLADAASSEGAASCCRTAARVVPAPLPAFPGKGSSCWTAGATGEVAASPPPLSVVPSSFWPATRPAGGHRDDGAAAASSPAAESAPVQVGMFSSSAGASAVAASVAAASGLGGSSACTDARLAKSLVLLLRDSALWYTACGSASLISFCGLCVRMPDTAFGGARPGGGGSIAGSMLATTCARAAAAPPSAPSSSSSSSPL
mmetsp:Transcript_42344/g.109824  ORF Transcript_42344/g.109824 Transcript_42344/m.109824 type:complete len:247 (+) Transcript_42344:719-1459(+)